MRSHYNHTLTKPDKRLLLVGAGNAHLVLLKAWRMRPEPGVTVTLVSEEPVVFYSAMLSGYLAGEYRRDEVRLDLARFCAGLGVRFVAARAVRLDTAARRLHVEGRPALGYDLVSLALGSGVRVPPVSGTARSLPVRPLSKLVEGLEALGPRPRSLAVVGGGVTGVELALALRGRYRDGTAISLVHGGARLAPELPRGAGHRLRRWLDAAGVQLRLGDEAIALEGRTLQLRGGGGVDTDAVLWATTAAAPDLFRASGLPIDAEGFLRVDRHLRVEGGRDVFGAGDSVAVAGGALARSGVIAVRQGALLEHNVRRSLAGRPLRSFRAPPAYLSLVNGGSGRGLWRYGPWSGSGRAARRWKDRIDRAWVDSFRPPARTREEPMPCGGCAAKVPADVLASALERLTVPARPEVLLGLDAREDAAVFRPRADRVQVQTVDFFPAFLDDPFLFGKIAAVHALSDLYAMSAEPFAALALVALPPGSRDAQAEQLSELLAGANEALAAAGAALAGGHSSLGAELALGFVVTGHAKPGRLFRKGGLVPGQRLVLTKPLGSGALLAAWRRGACRTEWLEALLVGLATSNAAAARVLAEAEVAACTDVTGFGLAGHLLEMCDASGVSAELRLSSIPVYDGFDGVIAAGIRSSLHDGNARYRARVRGEAPACLFDPQTSGGLLAAVPGDRCEAILEALHAAGVPASAIGAVRPGSASAGGGLAVL